MTIILGLVDPKANLNFIESSRWKNRLIFLYSIIFLKNGHIFKLYARFRYARFLIFKVREETKLSGRVNIRGEGIKKRFKRLRIIDPYYKPTQVGEARSLRCTREPSFRNSAKQCA